MVMATLTRSAECGWSVLGSVLARGGIILHLIAVVSLGAAMTRGSR